MSQPTQHLTFATDDPPSVEWQPDR